MLGSKLLDHIAMDPPFRIGIIGGGQLGKMMTVEAKKIGMHVTVLDPTPECPAGQVADDQYIAAFHDQKAIRELVESVHVTTYEFEHIDSLALIRLEDEGRQVFPAPRVLKVIQNKFTQKSTLLAAGIPVPEFRKVSTASDIERAAKDLGYPLLLKACTGGYDGKGNYLLTGEQEIEQALSVLRCPQLIVEAYVPFVLEVSMIVARGRDNRIKSYPLVENIHQENILRTTIVPARVSGGAADKARRIAEEVVRVFEGIGVFCVEMFITGEGEVLVNEVAPRPHNSGHYTIEACVTSQFAQHIRAISGLPLGDTRLLSPAVMVNLLGAEDCHGPAVLTGLQKALALPGVQVHLYGKKTTAPKRKMGHLTVVAPELPKALEIAAEAASFLHVVSDLEGGKTL
ncbi:MAG: 5-(carboxyamino)imidazole ribonucleotide synthase [Bacillota bacterium]